MTVNNNLSKIISLVTSKGFQIHPEALSLIENFQEDSFFQIMEDILREKKENKEKSMVIISDDIKNFVKFSSNKILKVMGNSNNTKDRSTVSRTLTPTPTPTPPLSTIADNYQYNEDKKTNKTTETILSIKRDSNNKHKETTDENFKIIYDSNDKINSGEGVEGYTSLFRSRYEKSLKILSLRQNSKKIKKIEIIKQLFNQSKTDSNPMSKEFSNNSLFAAGLIMNKEIKNNSYDITIDDQTGLLTATTYNDDLKKQISMLTVDQMVMIEFENSYQKEKECNKECVFFGYSR